MSEPGHDTRIPKVVSTSSEFNAFVVVLGTERFIAYLAFAGLEAGLKEGLFGRKRVRHRAKG